MGKELGPCLKAKERLWQNPPQFIDTMAEGIKTQQVIIKNSAKCTNFLRGLPVTLNGLAEKYNIRFF